MGINQDSYNKGGFIALIGSVTFCLLFFIYISFIHPGVDLMEVEEVPEGQEQIQLADDAPAKVDVSQIEKPWEANPDMIAHGSQVYKTNCAVCHGPNGEGDGPAGSGLVPPPRNLVQGGWKRGGTSIDLYVTLQKGLEGTSMAAFGHLPKTDRWALVQYIRNITTDKPEDDAAKLEEFAKTAE